MGVDKSQTGGGGCCIPINDHKKVSLGSSVDKISRGAVIVSVKKKDVQVKFAFPTAKLADPVCDCSSCSSHHLTNASPHVDMPGNGQVEPWWKISTKSGEPWVGVGIGDAVCAHTVFPTGPRTSPYWACEKHDTIVQPKIWYWSRMLYSFFGLFMVIINLVGVSCVTTNQVKWLHEKGVIEWNIYRPWEPVNPLTKLIPIPGLWRKWPVFLFHIQWKRHFAICPLSLKWDKGKYYCLLMCIAMEKKLK